jgi:hypothetical protein
LAIPAIIHLVGEDAIYGELDEPPNPTHQFLFLRNIRQKDGKPLNYVADGAEVFLYAWHKITFVEIMSNISLPGSNGATPTPGVVGAPSSQKAASTTVLGFFRDDDN